MFSKINPDLLKKVKSNYFIVRPKVDPGLLSLPHLGIFAIHMR